MMVKILSIVLNISKYSGCRIITVDSRPDVVDFYTGFGFKRAIAKPQETIPLYFDYHKYVQNSFKTDVHLPSGYGGAEGLMPFDIRTHRPDTV